MNKQTILLLLCMSVTVMLVSSCGVKYARPDRCVCGMCEKDADTQDSQTQEDDKDKQEEFKQLFQEEQQQQQEEKVFTIDFEKLAKQNLYEFDSAKISDSTYEQLDIIIEYMKENPTTTVRIEGHADDVGDDVYNQKLSERRASVVADYLVEKGIEKERVSSIGFGKTRPKYDNSTEEGRAKNRRTEFVFTR